jgi:SAM-dependent MidA family methyltransferase
LGFVETDLNKSRVPNPESRISDVIRERGPMTVAAFMELALYHPELGYYARAARRSGRAGDFFTSVDVGPLFGELLEIQLEEMARLLCGEPRTENPESRIPNPESRFDLVEAGAGSGQLAADIARAARERHPAFYRSLRLHLVEASAAARAAQRDTLGEAGERLAASSDALPESFQGALVANELLDAMPAHQVVMREAGLREIYVDVARPLHSGAGRSFQGRQRDARDQGEPERAALHLIEGPPSTPDLQAYLDRVDATLEPGWRAEINLRAIEWVRAASRALARGFIVLIDYGHEARELYSATHSLGTLTSYAAHRAAGAESPGAPAWLLRPGEQDITAHVDFTSVRAAAEAEGLTTIGFLDQTYFLLGLLGGVADPQSAIRNPQFRTLIVPGGLGSAHKVLIFGKNVGAPPLRGLSFKVRVT